jgi:hypothetical protein
MRKKRLWTREGGEKTEKDGEKMEKASDKCRKRKQIEE